MTPSASPTAPDSPTGWRDNALVLGSGLNRSGSVSVVQALRFGGGALSPVAFTPIYHADPLIGFLLPAALLAIAVPAALPGHHTSAKWLC